MLRQLVVALSVFSISTLPHPASLMAGIKSPNAKRQPIPAGTSRRVCKHAGLRICALLALIAIGTTVAGGPAAAQCIDYGEFLHEVGSFGEQSLSCVDVQGNYAYIGGRSGLQILDVTDPTNPDIVGDTGDEIGAARGVDVVGNYAYVADKVDNSSTLHVIDVADPSRPIIRGTEPIPGWPTDVEVVGGYAYVTCRGPGSYFFGLQVIDVSDPTRPYTVALLDTYGLWGVDVEGSYAYVAGAYDGYKFGGLMVIDIRAPVPTSVGHTSTWGSTSDVDVVGDYAFAVNTAPPPPPPVAPTASAVKSETAVYYEFVVVDVSDPTSPEVVAKLDLRYDSHLWSITVEGDYAYVTSDTGLQVVNIANPLSPVYVGGLLTGAAGEVDVEGRYAYVTGRYGLRVIDAINPESPGVLGSLRLPFAPFPCSAGDGIGIDVGDGYAYVAASRCRFHVLDITSPESPLVVGSVETPRGTTYDVTVAGNYAYVAAANRGVEVINVTDPLNPAMAGSVDTPNSAQSTSVVGNYAYVADNHSGLQVIDITQPSSPMIVGSVDTPGRARDVSLVGTYAYVADYESGLQVISVTDPKDPALVASVDLPGEAAVCVLIAGDHAYVFDPSLGVVVVDITDPINPVVVGSAHVPDASVQGCALAIMGNYAYASGLQVIDISDPRNPMTIGGELTELTSGQTKINAVVGDYVYVGTTVGLQILPAQCSAPPEIACPTNPVEVQADLPGTVCVGLPVNNAELVSVTGANWADDALCFDADTVGTYEFQVTATNSYGSDECRVAIDVKQPAATLYVHRRTAYLTPDSVETCSVVDLKIEHAWDLKTLEAEMQFDCSKVEVKGFEPGELMTTSGATVTDSSEYDSVACVLTVRLVAEEGEPLRRRPDGTLMRIYLQATSNSGSSVIDVRAVSARDTVGNVVPLDTRVGYTEVMDCLLGDYDNDWDVDFADFTRFVYYWNQPVHFQWADIAAPIVGDPPGPVPWCGDYPYCCDGKVDFEDLMLFTSMYGWSHDPPCPAGPVTTPVLSSVPETRLQISVPQKAALNQTVTFRMVLSDVSSIAGWYSVLNYDHTVLTYEGNNFDEIAEEHSKLLSNLDRLDPGKITTQRTILGDEGLTESGPVTVEFYFEPVDVGAAYIELERIDLRTRVNTPVEVGDAYTGRNEIIVSSGNGPIPLSFKLEQNFPNPFNPSTTIRFSLPAEADYELTVYNTRGQRITRQTGHAKAGAVELIWKPAGLASGIYYYRVRAGANVDTRKMVLLK